MSLTAGQKATADEYMMEMIDWYEEFTGRFLGHDLQFRRSTNSASGNAWPHPWRARVVTSKNERDEYRITVYGADLYAVLKNLREAIAEVDRK